MLTLQRQLMQYVAQALRMIRRVLLPDEAAQGALINLLSYFQEQGIPPDEGVVLLHLIVAIDLTRSMPHACSRRVNFNLSEATCRSLNELQTIGKAIAQFLAIKWLAVLLACLTDIILWRTALPSFGGPILPAVRCWLRLKSNHPPRPTRDLRLIFGV